MAHNVRAHMRCPHKQDLAASRITLLVLNTRKRLCRVTGAVKNNLGGRVLVCFINTSKFSSDESHAIFFPQPFIQVQAVSGRVDGQSREGATKPDAFGKLLA